MLNKPENHRSEESRLFGLLPAFLVWRSGVKTPETSDGFKTEIEALEEAEQISDKEIQEALKNFEAFKEKVSKKIKQYNETTDQNYSSYINPHLEPLLKDVSNFDKLIDQIDKILSANFFDERYSGDYSREDYTEEQRITSLAESDWEPHQSRKKALLEIRSMLTKSPVAIHGGRPQFIDGMFLASQWNKYLTQRPSLQIPTSRAPHKDEERKTLAEQEGSPSLMQLNAIKADMEEALIIMRGKLNYIELKKAYSQVLLQIELINTIASDENIEDKKSELDDAIEKAAQRSMTFITDNMEEALEYSETKSKLQEKPAYDAASKAYDRATKSPIISAGSEEFKNFWTDPEYGVSTSDRDESKNLFFSILRRTTDNFESNFILGDDFGEDAEENRKKYPFLYVEWLKFKGVKEEDIREYDREVDEVMEEMIGVPHVEDIVQGINNSSYQIGLDISDYEKAKNIVDDEKSFKAMGSAVYHYRQMLERKVQSDDKLQADDKINEAIEHLRLHEKLLEAQQKRANKIGKKKGAEEKFTKSSLKENPQLVMELAMRKFHKAMIMVDETLPHGNWKIAYNPTVRRLLIAQIYDEGVSEYRIDFGTGKDYYEDNLSVDSRWMLNALGSSPYYNRFERGEKMSPAARKLIPVAHLANRVAVELEHYEEINGALEAVAKWHDAAGNPAEQKRIEDEELSKFPKGMVKIFKKQTAVKLRAELQANKAMEEKSKQFLAATTEALKNPESDAAKTLIANIESGVYPDIITKEMLQETDYKLRNVEADYRMFELDAESRMDFMERLGVNIEGVYEAYQAAINQKPEKERYEYSVKNWDRLLASQDPADFEKLMFMLEQIVSDGHDKQGKQHFLNAFRSLHGEGSTNLGANTEFSKVHIMGIYRMIKGEINDREVGYALNEDKRAEYFAKIEGETFGDKATRYIKSAVNMLVGPGQSWANRGAGLVLLIAGLKAAQAAYKGETKMGKALRLLFVGGAAELAMKEVTGKGILERFGFETLMEAGEGTSEAVLVADGAEHMEDKMVGPEEQTRALYELRKVPFKDVMAWYMDPNTNKENGMVSEGKEDKFPDQIDLGNIVFGEKWANYEPEVAGKRVVMQTIKHFFEYTARKNSLAPHEGAEMLQDRWVDSLKPNYDPKYTRFTIPPALIAEYKKKPDELTWGIVIDAEIDQKDRNETIGTHGASKVIDYFEEKGKDFIKWSRQTLFSPATLAAKRFRDSLGEKAEGVADFADKLAEKAETKVHFTAESMKLAWEEHEIEIRNFFGNNVELIWEGVKFFPSALIGINQWAVPKLLTALKQGKEILFEDQIASIEGEHLSTEDIVKGDKVLMLDADFAQRVRDLREADGTLSPETAIERVKSEYQAREGSVEPQIQELMSDPNNPRTRKEAEDILENRGVNIHTVTHARNKALQSPYAYEREKNPNFEYLGIYQRPFMEALSARENPEDINTPMYYVNDDFPDEHVGYLITETTLEQSGADNIEYDSKTKHSKMAIEARKQAEDFFRTSRYAIKPEHIEDMLFPIHVAVKSDRNGIKKRYTFWRMPIPGGKEFELRASGHWADSKVPDKYRHPFYVDPSRGKLGNFREAYGVDSPAARKAIAAGLVLTGRVGGVFMSASERLGKMVDWINNHTFNRGEEPSAFFEDMASWREPNKQMYDEIFGTAGTGSGAARSEFYSNAAHPERAAMYKALKDYAILTGEAYYYGIIPDRPVTSWDNPRPANFNETAWEAYYNAWLADHGYNPDGTLR